MQTTVKSWGNSQGIRLPKEILQDAVQGIFEYVWHNEIG